MEKAIFLDRDGVINYPVLNPKTNEYEAPFYPEDYQFFPWVIESLLALQELGYKLFVISNQPDYAKGKTTLERLKAIHKKMHQMFIEKNINFSDYFYCYHHPNGIVPEYTIKCECRKPGNLFLKIAKDRFNLDMFNSWMIGDRDSDVFCGQSSSLRTIQILLKESEKNAGKSKPDFKVNNLLEAVETIKKEINKGE